jgi:hypothetical protein
LDLSEIITDENKGSSQPVEDVTYDLQSIVIHRGEYGSGKCEYPIQEEVTCAKYSCSSTTNSNIFT